MALDRFATTTGPWPAEYLRDPVGSAVIITPSDSVQLTVIPKSIYVGVAGDITMLLAKDTVPVLFKAVANGVCPVRPLQIYATGTTATNIVALN